MIEEPVTAELYWNGPSPFDVAAWLIAELQWKFENHAHTVRQEGSLTSRPR